MPEGCRCAVLLEAFGPPQVTCGPCAEQARVCALQERGYVRMASDRATSRRNYQECGVIVESAGMKGSSDWWVPEWALELEHAFRMHQALKPGGDLYPLMSRAVEDESFRAAMLTILALAVDEGGRSNPEKLLNYARGLGVLPPVPNLF